MSTPRLRDRFRLTTPSPADATDPVPTHEFLLRFWRERQAAERDNDEKRRAAKQREQEVLDFYRANSKWVGTFGGENVPFLPVVLDGAMIHFENYDAHVRLTLELSEDCTIDKLRAHWYIIAEWQQRLLRWQGPSTRDFRGELYAYLALLHPGLSYEDLAKRLNSGFADLLAAYLPYERGPACQPHAGGLAMAEGVDPNGSVRAFGLLLHMGLSAEDAMKWCDEALTNLRQGEPAFLPDGGPITAARVRSRIRARKGKAEGVVRTG